MPKTLLAIDRKSDRCLCSSLLHIVEPTDTWLIGFRRSDGMFERCLHDSTVRLATPADFAEALGPSADDYKRVVRWADEIPDSFSADHECAERFAEAAARVCESETTTAVEAGEE